MAARLTETRALGNLFLFARDVCGFRDVSPSLHGEICERITETLVQRQGNLAVVIPRDMFKSSIGQATILYLFTREAILDGNYQFRVLVDTATLVLSMKHIAWVGRTMRANAEYRRLFGDFYGKGVGFGQREIYVKQRSKGGNAKEPNFMASALRAEVTGLHFDFHWYDDIVAERNWHTKDLRQKGVEHFHNSLNLLEPHGSILYTATPWHDGDNLGVLRRQEKERERNGLPKFFDFYFRAALETPERVPDDERGESIFPERQPTDFLHNKKSKTPKFMWRAQQMCDPTVPDYAIPFDRESMYVSRDRFPRRLRIKVVTVDPNFRDADQVSGDNACIVVGGFDAKMNFWVEDVRLGTWSASDFIDQLFDVYRTWHPHVFRIERKFTSFLEYAIRERGATHGVHLPLIWINRDWRSKETRYASLETVFASKRIKFASELSASVKAEIEEELERVGSSAHDDFLDALTDQFTGMYPTIAEEGEDGSPEFVPAGVTSYQPRPLPSSSYAFGMFMSTDDGTGEEWEN